jgi:phosphoribosylformimino-5-aminoimidazole carboxamide ribotide isomerase
MIVFPAIDLKGGQVVRLAEGDMARHRLWRQPAAQAQIFAAGSQFLHVVDLDGSFAGRAENREAVEAILQSFEGHVQWAAASARAIGRRLVLIWACRAW